MAMTLDVVRNSLPFYGVMRDVFFFFLGVLVTSIDSPNDPVFMKKIPRFHNFEFFMSSPTTSDDEAKKAAQEEQVVKKFFSCSSADSPPLPPAPLEVPPVPLPRTGEGGEARPQPETLAYRVRRCSARRHSLSGIEQPFSQ